MQNKKLTDIELKELLFEELYEFVLKHKEIQIKHSIIGENIVDICIDLTIYECDKSHANSFIRGYQIAYESK